MRLLAIEGHVRTIRLIFERMIRLHIERLFDRDASTIESEPMLGSQMTPEILSSSNPETLVA
jgi:hypothetical protein